MVTGSEMIWRRRGTFAVEGVDEDRGVLAGGELELVAAAAMRV